MPKLAIKLILSLALLYHLAAVLVLPNSSSLLGRNTDWLFLGYANPLLLNRTWQFFSPGPMPNAYLEYEVETVDNGTDAVRKTVQWPVRNENGLNNDFFLRTVAGMRFLSMSDANFQAYFVPYLCGLHPGAVALDLRSVIEQVPSIERSGGYEDFKDMQQRSEITGRRYECPGAPQPTYSEVIEEDESVLDQESKEAIDQSGDDQSGNDQAGEE